MDTYASDVKTHLADYKTRVLGISEDGTWRRNDRRYPHILPESLKRSNILEPIRDDFWGDFDKHNIGKLHQDFHHLTSSQALGFNLFYPLIDELDWLLPILGICGQRVHVGRFEVVLDSIERTNFDYLMYLEGSAKIFVEIKYTEAGFGTVKDSAVQRDRWSTIYQPRLQSLVDEQMLQPEVFFKNYQLLRNVSYLSKYPDSWLLLIYPEANRKVDSQAKHVIEHLVGGVRDRVKIVYLEALVDILMRSATVLGRSTDGYPTGGPDYFNSFNEKYTPECLRSVLSP